MNMGVLFLKALSKFCILLTFLLNKTILSTYYKSIGESYDREIIKVKLKQSYQ